MKKNLTEIVFVLDRSGSMAGLEQDTIGGFNSLIGKQREEEGEALISTVLFDHHTEVIHDRVPLDRVPPLTRKEYYVRGSTALLDAVGASVHHIGNVHKYAREEDRPEHTLFVITTDGMENASRRYSYEKVRQMIEKQKNEHGWEFLFLGANMDAAKEAARMGIEEGCAADYDCDPEGMALSYDVLAETISKFRAEESIQPDWKTRLGKNYRKKK